jgi:hypothetical protein
VQSTLWYNTAGLDYSDSLSIEFDACVIIPGDGRSMYRNTFLRSQHDNGSCLATLDASCIEAFQRQSEDFAMELVNSPTFLSDGNLIANSIVGVCDEIARRMATTLPQQCRPYFNETQYRPIGVALTTDYKFAGLFFGSPGDPCMVKGDFDETLNGVTAYLYAEDNATTHALYDRLQDDFNPVLTVFMPVANSERSVSVMEASSTVTCVRVTDYNPGTRIPASRGEPTPVHISTSGASLSNGEIAGVVVAIVLGFGLLVAALVVWWLRRRKAGRSVAQPFPSDSLAHEKFSHVLQRLGTMGPATSLLNTDLNCPMPGARTQSSSKHRMQIADILEGCRYDLFGTIAIDAFQHVAVTHISV